MTLMSAPSDLAYLVRHLVGIRSVSKGSKRLRYGSTCDLASRSEAVLGQGRLSDRHRQTVANFMNLSRNTGPEIAATAAAIPASVTRSPWRGYGSMKPYRAKAALRTQVGYRIGSEKVESRMGAVAWAIRQRPVPIPPGRRRRSPAPGSHRTWRADFPHHALRLVLPIEPVSCCKQCQGRAC